MSQKYLPHTEEDIKQMLEKIGVNDINQLFDEIPSEARLDRDYNLNNGLSELELRKVLTEMANKNKGTESIVSFLGAGAYDHYIPSVINHLILRSEFYTAYTPYQPEVSQGTLQYIFEYQSMICELTNMDVANASMYDGATATAEAVMMAAAATRRNKVLVSSTFHPNSIEVIETYCKYRGIEVELINVEDGVTSIKEIESKLDKSIAAVVVQNPNFYGIIEDTESVVEAIHSNKSLLIMNVNPMTLGLLKTPGEIGADIVCGEAQPFGMPLSYGGPYLGFLATTNKYMRKMPGRICGQTSDLDGKRAFVLTLQAREQHIRREKANSNICSNQSLNALVATIYLSTLGKEGLVEVGEQNIKKAHYAYNQITGLPNFDKVYDKPFFNEFVVKSNVEFSKINEALKAEGFVVGLHLGEYDENLKNHILICVTEKKTKAEIDKLVKILGGIE